MNVVYILFHSYERDNGDEESKILGVFSEYSYAENAIKKYANLPGFNKYPNEYIIDKYVINELHWIEGFVTMPIV